jgi:flagellar secretion chaperone FliS
MKPTETAHDSDNSNNSSQKESNMFLSVQNRAASAYNRVGLETSVQGADAHELIHLLYTGLLQTLPLARLAVEQQDIMAKNKHIGKCIRLIDEGLKASLSPLGGELTERLKLVYTYSLKRLLEANLRNDVQAIDEVHGLISPIADAWKTIRAEVVKGQ